MSFRCLLLTPRKEEIWVGVCSKTVLKQAARKIIAFCRNCIQYNIHRSNQPKVKHGSRMQTAKIDHRHVRSAGAQLCTKHQCDMAKRLIVTPWALISCYNSLPSKAFHWTLNISDACWLFQSLVLVWGLEFAFWPWRTLLLASTSIVWHWDLWQRWMAVLGKKMSGSSWTWTLIDGWSWNVLVLIGRYHESCHVNICAYVCVHLCWGMNKGRSFDSVVLTPVTVFVVEEIRY